MSTTFENKTVDVRAIFDVLLYPQIKYLAFMFGLMIVLKLFLKASGSEYKARIYEVLTRMMWCLFKVFIYGCLAVIVFFYNFETKEYHLWQVPDKMLISTVFVGLLAIYEVVSNVLEMIKLFMDYLRGD